MTRIGRWIISFGLAPASANRGGERALTLVELLIVLAIMSLVAGAIMSVFMTSLRTYWKGSLNTQVQQAGRISFDRLTRDLRAARKLVTATVQGGFTFNTSCTQISFILPHLGLVTLNDGKTVIYATDLNGVGSIPYDGYYVSYYLTLNQGSTVPNPGPNGGPYLNKTVYDINATALSTVTIAGPEQTAGGTTGGANVSNLAFAVGGGVGGCPVVATRDILVTVTASQQATGQNLQDTSVFTGDISLRNQ